MLICENCLNDKIYTQRLVERKVLLVYSPRVIVYAEIPKTYCLLHHTAAL